MRPDNFDWRKPDYAPVWMARMKRLSEIRRLAKEIPDYLPVLREFYKNNPSEFIEDWGVTFDPRLVERGLPGFVPMILFDKQRELIEAMVRAWKASKPLLVEKSRDCGASYVAVQLACTLCSFYEGMSIGFGSRKGEYVDKIEEPKSIFWKARLFQANLPEEFRCGWEAWRDAPHMRMNFPQTGSKMTGEAGDQIGRGDRQAIYIVDESAHLERPKLVEASLSQTTNCRIDMSSVKGMDNPFAEKRHAGRIEVFVFDWRDDPRKDQAWYDKQVAELDPVTVAQEIDRDYSASVEGIVIPGEWVRACLDADVKLGIKPSGRRTLSLDIADEGPDKNAAVAGPGILIDVIEEWSGKGSDTFATAERAFTICDDHDLSAVRYDSDGIGASFRGDARVILERRQANGQRRVMVEAFRGSEGVHEPEKEDVKGRKNRDYFANRKAQAWWSLRTRARNTFMWIEQGVECAPDEIMSIRASHPLARRLVTELSQPTYELNGLGKIVINKQPDGMKSPNLGDACMQKFARVSSKLEISPETLARAAGSAIRGNTTAARQHKLPGGGYQRKWRLS